MYIYKKVSIAGQIKMGVKFSSTKAVVMIKFSTNPGRFEILRLAERGRERERADYNVGVLHTHHLYMELPNWR
jgi:hypothetical protein